MEDNTSQGPPVEQPRRLTKVERARLEALKSFGCEDFGSVLQNTRKITLKSKLKPSQASNGEENTDCLKETRQINWRSQSFQRGKLHTRQNRPTKAELAKIESLKSFQNNSFADITNSSKRIVSKFLNKPAKKCQNQGENTSEASKTSPDPEDLSQPGATNNMVSNECGEEHGRPLDTTAPEEFELDLNKHIQILLDTNEKVLRIAKDLDL